jgi:hypothetical protein
MDQQQRELRRAAANAFIESLEQLQATLQSADSSPVQPAPSATSSKSERRADTGSEEQSFDLSSFEQAAEDIEHFIQQMQEEEETAEEETK